MSTSKERLFIKKIEIENAGRFYGSNHSIDLSDSSEKNITVIIGYSGRGKSTIHNLIYWCLYGDHKPSEEDSTKLDYGLINDDALGELTKGDSVTASVTLSLHSDQEERYVLTRKLTATYNRESTKRRFERQNNSRVQDGIDFETTVKLKMIDEGENMIWETNPVRIKNEINKHLPQHLSDFFLFDGENLIKFRNQSSSDFIKDGITKISGLEILGALSNSAKITAESIHRHIGGKSAEAAPFYVKIERIEGQEKKLKQEIEQHKKNLEINKNLHEDVIDKIKKNKDGAKLIAEQKKTRRNKTNAQRELIQTNEKIKDMLFEKIPQLLVRDTLQESERIFARLEDEDRIPPSISRSAIDKILISNPLKCICGREFTKDENGANGPWTTLNKIKSIIIDDSLSQGISLGRELISRIIDTSAIEKSQKEYSELILKRREKRNEIQTFKAEEEDLDQQIKDRDDDEHEDLGSRKTEYWKKCLEEIGQISTKESELDDFNIKLADERKSYDGALEKEGKYKTETNKIYLANAVNKFTKILEKRVEEFLRTQTQTATSKYFKESAPQKDDFKNVEISHDYDIAAKDKKDQSASLSKGQAHVLGLSYVAGIREITHTNTFLIIDSPLHNISGTHRNEISEVFSKYLPDVQIVLLVTDTEYLHGDPDGAKPVKNILQEKGRVWKEYFIEEIKTDDGIQSRKITEYIK